MKRRWPKQKLMMLLVIVGIYLVAAILFMVAAGLGIIKKTPAEPAQEEFGSISDTSDIEDDQDTRDYRHNLQLAQDYFNKNFVRENKHIVLTIPLEEKESAGRLNDTTTNSEALSYYLLWNARAANKKEFDETLDFIENSMMHPDYGYLRWHLDEQDIPTADGSNIASDADLRAIKALVVAQERWDEDRYEELISRIARGMQGVAVTQDSFLSPYGGVAGENSLWTTNEVWLSYSDFLAFRELAQRYGEPWNSIYVNMKDAVLDAQLENGLYNSQLTQNREYGNGIDSGAYSINSLWIMIRAAESNDPELERSAERSLQFYKNAYERDGELYISYMSNGDPASQGTSPWVYALVARAAVYLDDEDFASQMVEELIERQFIEEDAVHKGAIVEGSDDERYVSQFTMQESILTLLAYVERYN